MSKKKYNLSELRESIYETAKRLAKANAEAEPNIKEIYLFPNDKEIRLIEIDTTTVPSPQIEPFYIGSTPASGIAFPSAIALIRPEEKDLDPPDDWGAWEDAELVWSQE
jgi:hypothetical protein